MKIIKKLSAFLLAMIFAVSGMILGYAENNATEEPEENQSTQIRICQVYHDQIRIAAYFELEFRAYETINLYQRDENNNKTLLISLPCEKHCYTSYISDENNFGFSIPDANIFADQGSYTFEFVAMETPPEGYNKQSDVIIDFDYEDIVNPEIESKDIDYTLNIGQSADIMEIIGLPEDYLGVYLITVNNNEGLFDEQFIEKDGNIVTGISRGDVTVIVEDVYSGINIAQINLRVIPEVPDNFLGLIGSTFGIIGEDIFKSLSSVGIFGSVGILGLGYTILFPFVALFSIIGSLFGL